MSSFWSGLAQSTGALRSPASSSASQALSYMPGGSLYGTPRSATDGSSSIPLNNGLYETASYQPGGANYGKKIPNRLDQATSHTGDYLGADRSQYLQTLAGGQDALNRSTQAAISAGMPAFNQELQQQRESNVRRGVSTGDLGTSFEGDITSAFQRNIANATAGQAMNLFNTQAQGYGNLYGNDTNNYLALLTGNSDRAQSASNAKTGFWNSVAGGVGSIAGAYLGNR